MMNNNTLQADLQNSLQEVCNFREYKGDLHTFKRLLHRIEHMLSVWFGPEDDSSTSNEDSESLRSNLILQPQTLSGFISILAESHIPSAYIKANTSMEVLFYRKILSTICDTISKYVLDPLNPVELDKLIDKVASLLLEDNHSIYEREVLHKLLHIITSNLISSDSNLSVDLIDGERHSRLRLTVTESVELTRILMQCSICRIHEANTRADEHLDDERDNIQLHIFLGFVFRHLLSFDLPFHDILQSHYAAKGRAAMQQYLDLVETYLRETIEYSGNLNYHSLQVLSQRHSLDGVSQLQDIYHTVSLVNACISYTSLSLGVIETICMELRVSALSFDELFANLWVAFSELVAFICQYDILVGSYRNVCDAADNLLLRLYKVISDDATGWSDAYRKSHEKAFHGAAITTLSRLLHCLDTHQPTDLDHDQLLGLLLNNFRALSYNDLDMNGSVSTLSSTDILYFVLHYLVTYEGEYAPYLRGEETLPDSIGEHEQQPNLDEETQSYFQIDPLNPWNAVVSEKWKSHMLSISHTTLDQPTGSTSASSVSDISFPNKRMRQ